jgi:hypothetical protein
VPSRTNLFDETETGATVLFSWLFVPFAIFSLYTVQADLK